MNKYKLEYYRKIKGLSTDELCKKIGISKIAYYRKINNKSQFNREEIEKIINVLQIPDPMDIFFNSDVSQKTK